MPSKLEPNGVVVGSVSSLPTCDSTIAGKLVFNTNDNKLYYCNGTEWKPIPYEPSLTASATAYRTDRPTYEDFSNTLYVEDLRVYYDEPKVLVSTSVELGNRGVIIATGYALAYRASGASEHHDTRLEVVIDDAVVGSASIPDTGKPTDVVCVAGYKVLNPGTYSVVLRIRLVWYKSGYADYDYVFIIGAKGYHQAVALGVGVVEIT